MTHELDGKYQVTSASSYRGPIVKKSDGETEIRNGKTERYDKANCKWTSTFIILNETEVEMVSLADPTESDADFLLIAPDGSPTSEPTTYHSILKLARKDDRIQMSGQIDYGNEVVFLTLKKIGA